MSNFTFNIAKGKVRAFCENVENNTPTGCEIVAIALNVTGDQDAAMIDVDTVSALLALSNVAEVTNTNYSRIDNVAANIAITVDDTLNRIAIDIDDQVFATILAGDPWTDLVFAFDPTGSSADTALVPLVLHDMVATPNGENITGQPPATGFFLSQ